VTEATPPAPATPDEDAHRLVLDMATSLAGSLQRGEVIRRVLDWAITSLGADRATLSHFTADQVVIEATAGQREALTWVGRAYPLASLETQPPVWQAIQERRVMLSGTLDDTRVFPEFREAIRQVRHLAALPLVIDAQPIGLLVLSRRDDPPFSDTDLPAMTLLAGVAALALRNALLFHELQSSARALEAAVDAARDIAAQVDTESALRLLLSHAVRAAGADQGSMLELDGAETVVRVSTSGRVPRGARFPLATATTDAISSGAPRELAAADYLASQPQTGDTVGVYARFLVVPLIVGGTTLGVLALGRHADQPFSGTEMDGVQQVASLAGMLLRNAFLLDEAKQANQARVEFVDMAVHELRSPLTVILGYLSMLADGDIDAAAMPSLFATMRAKAEQMSEAVDEMLSLARLEARSLPLRIDEVDVATLLADAAARAEGRASLRHGSVRVGQADAVRVAADVLLAGRILDNLVNNALAYSDAPPQVVLSARSAEGAHAVEIRVADNGRGIAPDLVERVFERFFRADPSSGGTGLGLYLSRGLAEAMGGSLVLESSALGAGSVFLLTLPRAATTH
jgi:signal transduction histidine kinase